MFNRNTLSLGAPHLEKKVSWKKSQLVKKVTWKKFVKYEPPGARSGKYLSPASIFILIFQLCSREQTYTVRT